MLRKMLRATAFAAVAAALAGTAQANPYETTLANGMDIIVKEDRRAPSVVHMMWYGIGSMDEPDGVSGIAHMLEHMMFKGTEKLAPGEFNRRVAERGGRDNAFTGRDYTAYFQQIPPAHLEEMMEMEADRMANLVIRDQEFLPEREVVKEERRLRTDDNPRALVWEQLMAAAWAAHPYRRPIIGWMYDIENYRVEDARRWHEHWYAPNNARLVVVGDVDHGEVFAMAERHFGALAARELPARRITEEPEQRGLRHVEVRAPAELPAVTLAWKAPTLREPAGDRDVYALQVLAAVLDGYDGARLPRRLVREERIAVSVDASYGGVARGPSLFVLGATPAKGHTVAEVEAALRAEITRIADEGVDQTELSRVLTQTLASEVYKRDSLMGQAMEIGFLEASGLSWRDEQALLDGIRAVTADEVREVAQRYFGDETLTRAVLDPLPLDAAERTPRNRFDANARGEPR
ncbi:M16 family metallopeptidase [Pseudazoarcus pumilus]|uniref:Peptidase M16 n=1 Tax=Pseudazoarcus pumilus TaxID=2067960 RepID=A0A2I6S4Z0_9RHOO|nr:peptidase M16 [Pseudazoarcus pumilus]